jgi:hypothetical protein
MEFCSSVSSRPAQTTLSRHVTRAVPCGIVALLLATTIDKFKGARDRVQRRPTKVKAASRMLNVIPAYRLSK